MHHRRVTRLLIVTFLFTGSPSSLFRVDLSKKRREIKSSMITTPFDFIILCVFFTSIQIKLLFEQNLNLMVRKMTVSPVQLIPPLIRNAVL